MRHYQKIIIFFAVIAAVIALSQGITATTRDDVITETQFPPIADIDPAAGLPQFVQYLFMLGLGLGGVLAFGMIVFAGLQWSLSGASASLQGDAKDRIMNAILGLILLLGAFVILNTINPAIVRMEGNFWLELGDVHQRELPFARHRTAYDEQCEQFGNRLKCVITWNPLERAPSCHDINHDSREWYYANTCFGAHLPVEVRGALETCLLPAVPDWMNNICGTLATDLPGGGGGGGGR